MTCYRFAVAAADWCARALHDHVIGTPSLGRKLNTPDSMDRAIYATLAQLSEHTKALALSVGETIPEAVIGRFLGFMRGELQDMPPCSPYA